MNFAREKLLQEAKEKLDAEETADKRAVSLVVIGKQFLSLA